MSFYIWECKKYKNRRKNQISARLFSDGYINIGSNCSINERTVLRCAERISIGNYVMISSDCYLTDNNSHSLSYLERRKDLVLGQDRSYKERGVVVNPVIIEDDVWIGRGCLDRKMMSYFKMSNDWKMKYCCCGECSN